MSDNTKQKKVIRARQEATGESYTTARMHVLRSLPPVEVPTVGLRTAVGLRAAIEATIRLAEAAAGAPDSGLRDLSSPTDRALCEHLSGLTPADLRKIEVLMYAGRSDGGIRELAAALAHDTHDGTVEVVAEKTLVLASYLREGLRVALAEGIDLDGSWLRKPSPKWAKAPGSDYDRAIDGMRAWDDRLASTRAEHDADGLRRAWARREGVTASDAHFCLTRLTVDGCKQIGYGCKHLPGSDHTSFWMKEGKPHIYVTQPYDISIESLDEMFRVCRRMGLAVRVDSAIAWHAPGAVLIEVFRASSLPRY